MERRPSRKASDGDWERELYSGKAPKARQPDWAFAVNCPDTFDESLFLLRLRDVPRKSRTKSKLQAKVILKETYGELRSCLFELYWRAHILH